MLFPYKTVINPVNHESKSIKNSKFIANIAHVKNEKEAMTQLQRIKEKYPDAGHHCWAYYLHENNKSRFNDDGEPNGSAGKPILAHLLGQDIFDVLVVVTRYFGGTKLGIGGLVRAYGGTAAEALDSANIVTITPQKTCWIKYDYNNTSEINTVFHRFGVEIIQSSFDKNILAQIKVPYDQVNKFSTAISSITKGIVNVLDKKPI